MSDGKRFDQALRALEKFVVEQQARVEVKRPAEPPRPLAPQRPAAA
jgi:hypothetical protein